MHFTKRRLDLRAVGALAAAIAVAHATASCSSDRSVGVIDGDDADSSLPPLDDGGPTDAGLTDAPAPIRDASMPDASPWPVTCTGASCATSLVTILGEGFCVLLQDKTVACWGDNANGQLGRGSEVGNAPSATAERVLDLAEIVSLDRACAIDTKGDTWCWGTGPWMRTAAATTRENTPVKLPIPPAKAIRVARTTANAGTACAVVESGVLCWGTNVNGTVMPPVPGATAATPYPPQEARLPTGAQIRDLVRGDAAFALLEDGTAFSWGANPPLARVSSLFPDPHPRPIMLAGVTRIDATNDNVCAVAGAAVYCWGRPKLDAFVSPPPLERALPKRIPMPEHVVDVSTCASANSSRNPLRGCAIGASGSLYCWGENGAGQVGDGTKAYALSPVKIDSLPEPVAQVRTTALSTCALLTSGRVFCWGDDSFGQLGGGQLRVPSLVPQEVLLP